MSEIVFHIASKSEWGANPEADYVPDAYAADGFIHLSFPHQVLTPANLFYRGRSDLLLLEIDRALLKPDAVVEPGTGTDELFPHLYSSLPRAAVVAEHPFPCDEDGGFSSLPRHLG